MKKMKSGNSYYGLSLIFMLFLVAQIPYQNYFLNFYYDVTIEAPSTVNVGDTFIISGTSRMSAAERVNLYIIDSKEPIGYAVVGTKPPFVYEFEVLVSSDSLTINGIVYDSGPIAGKILHVYVGSNSQRFNSSPTASITIET
ncbi:MAG: hypothetical protein WBF08_10595 [Candidatus Bathyarchaeia archaeon]